MPKHVTRKQVLGAVVAVGLAIALAQGAFAILGPPAHAEAGVEAAAETQRSGFGRPSGRGGLRAAGLPPLWMLDLSEAQQTQIDRVREAAREASASTRDQLREARRALSEATRSEVVDEGRIRALAGALASLEADELVRRAYLYADIWQILTPEQHEAVREMSDRRAERRERQIERFRNRRRQ